MVFDTLGSRLKVNNELNLLLMKSKINFYIYMQKYQFSY